jgi:uncharacterized protein (TIGR00297 family)
MLLAMPTDARVISAFDISMLPLTGARVVQASVWGSSIAGVICAWGAITTGEYALFQLGFVASFCSKLSDTVSSEIGKAYGRTTYLITTMSRVPAGTEGAVSLEGTLAGVGAALGFATLALTIGQVCQ